MARPSKPINLIDKKKTHLTKEQRNLREKAEADSLSGIPMSETATVKKDKIAHKEFLRLKKLLGGIGKDDALYETVINRYCELLSECENLKIQRLNTEELVQEIRKEIKDFAKTELDPEMKAATLIELTKAIVSMQKTTNKIDSLLNQKRTMLFGIEKENIFTIASALRTVPKQAEKKEDALLQALGK